jgi:hypothetical protein
VDNLTLIWVYVGSTSDSSKLSRRESAEAGEEFHSTQQTVEIADDSSIAEEGVLKSYTKIWN